MVQNETELPSHQRKGLDVNISQLIQEYEMTHNVVTALEYCGSHFKKGGFIAYYEEGHDQCEQFFLGKIQLMLTQNSTTVKFVIRRYSHEVNEVIAAWRIQTDGQMEVVTEAQLASHLQYSCIDLKEDGQYVTMAATPTLY